MNVQIPGAPLCKERRYIGGGGGGAGSGGSRLGACWLTAVHSGILVVNGPIDPFFPMWWA